MALKLLNFQLANFVEMLLLLSHLLLCDKKDISEMVFYPKYKK